MLFLQRSSNDLATAPDGIAGDSDRQLFICIRNRVASAFKMNGVEPALRGAHSAAKAHVRINLNSAAAKAPFCFFLQLFFREGITIIPEGLFCIFVVQRTLTRNVVITGQICIILVKGMCLTFIRVNIGLHQKPSYYYITGSSVYT